jgi:hypothetical protein
MGADTSGNDNHLAVTNLTATDQCTDTPTNNFCTIIPALNITLAEGNLVMTHNRSYWDGSFGSFGVTSGKWYWETKITSDDGNDRRIMGGIVSNPSVYTHIYDGKGTNADPTSTDYATVKTLHPSYAYTGWDTNYAFDGTSTYSNTWAVLEEGDIINNALDLDNNKFYQGINGSYIAADGGTDGDPAGNSNESYDILAASVSRVYHPSGMVGWGNNTATNKINFNFGNPSFTISSGNADANGYGNFEYAVPSGYYALCTKNLAEFG